MIPIEAAAKASSGPNPVISVARLYKPKKYATVPIAIAQSIPRPSEIRVFMGLFFHELLVGRRAGGR